MFSIWVSRGTLNTQTSSFLSNVSFDVRKGKKNNFMLWVKVEKIFCYIRVFGVEFRGEFSARQGFISSLQSSLGNIHEVNLWGDSIFIFLSTKSTFTFKKKVLAHNFQVVHLGPRADQYEKPLTPYGTVAPPFSCSYARENIFSCGCTVLYIFRCAMSSRMLLWNSHPLIWLGMRSRVWKRINRCGWYYYIPIKNEFNYVH